MALSLNDDPQIDLAIHSLAGVKILADTWSLPVQVTRVDGSDLHLFSSPHTALLFLGNQTQPLFIRVLRMNTQESPDWVEARGFVSLPWCGGNGEEIIFYRSDKSGNKSPYYSLKLIERAELLNHLIAVALLPTEPAHIEPPVNEPALA